MIPWVMFGHHGLFGDYLDAIHATGGFLRRLVINRPELAGDGEFSIYSRHERYRTWLERESPGLSAQLVSEDDFRPQDGDRFLFGFRGLKLVPWRERIRERWGSVFPPLVHPTAHVSPFAELGEGVFVGAQCVVAPNATVGDFTLLNRAATVGHDSRIAPCCVLGPRCALASGVQLAAGAVVGIGAVILENRSIGESAYVGASALVTRSVEPGVTVIGVPAAPMARRGR